MLSNEEVNVARRLIAQYRKFAREWQIFRWTILMLAFLILGVSFFGYRQMEKLAAFNTSDQLPSHAAENIGAVLDARFNLLREELQIYSGIMLHGLVGGLLLVLAVQGWSGRGSQASLKARLLETMLENNRTP